MVYLNAKDILPPGLLEQVQMYAAGKYLYVPQNKDDMKSWGELSGYREQLRKRNHMIINKFRYGVTIEELSKEYFLSEETVKKIVYSKKKTEELLFHSHIESAKEYDEHGLLEEWIHTERTALFQMDYIWSSDTILDRLACLLISFAEAQDRKRE